jgi:hypothetical protein
LNEIFSSNRTIYKDMASFTQNTGASGLKGKRSVALLLGLCLWAAAPVAFAQTTDSTYTLEAALAYAARNNRDLRASGFDEQLAREQVKEVRSQGLPQVNATGQLQDNLIIPTNLLPAEVFGGEPGTFIPVRFGTRYNAYGRGRSLAVALQPVVPGGPQGRQDLAGVCPTEHA